MASQLPPSPPPTPTSTTTTTTTITGLTDDLVREIFLHLPDLPSLVCAAFACRAFRRAVRSSPAFCRTFSALHARPLLAFFLQLDMEFVPVLPSRSRRSFPYLVAADFFDISQTTINGYFDLVDLRVDGSTNRIAACYNPLTQGLDLYISFTRPYQPDYVHLEFYTLSSEDGQGPSRVVCVRYEHRSKENTAFLFSSDTMDWQISRKATLVLCESDRITTSMLLMVRGLIFWRDWMINKIVLFDTVTCEFSLIDMPASLNTESDESTYRLGETKDEKVCIVDIQDNILVSWLMTLNDDDSAVGRWMLYKEFPLYPIVEEFTGCLMGEDTSSVSVELVAVISGYVYLSIFYCNGTPCCEVYLSLCLETSEMSELFKHEGRYTGDAHPYFMAWPHSLVRNKEQSETEFTGGSVLDNRPVCTEEASTILVTALQSFSQALMNDGDSNTEIVAELDLFLGLTEDKEGSLIRKITTVDAQLVSLRDHILRMRA